MSPFVVPNRSSPCWRDLPCLGRCQWSDPHWRWSRRCCQKMIGTSSFPVICDIGVWGCGHTTLLLALPAVEIWQILRLQVDGLARRSKLFLLYNFIYSLTCDMWHLTQDKWLVTRDVWPISSENFRSLALTAYEILQGLEDISKKTPVS